MYNKKKLAKQKIQIFIPVTVIYCNMGVRHLSILVDDQRLTNEQSRLIPRTASALRFYELL